MKNVQLLGAIVILYAVSSVPIYAAKAPPAGVGGLPYEAPLQPLPQGVGANISNNIQQAENSGPPDSARTVVPAEGNTGAQNASAEIPAKSVANDSAASSSKMKTLLIWFGVLVGLVGSIGGVWFVTNRYVSK